MKTIRRYRPALTAVIFGLALSGCGDAAQRASEGLPPSSPVAQNTLFTLHPADGQIRVAVETGVRAQALKPLAAASINNTTFTVDNGAIGSVDYDAVNNSVRFTPDQPLDYGKRYTATLNVRHQDGTPASAAWTFTTTPGEFTKRLTSTLAGAVNDTFAVTPPYIRQQSLYPASRIGGSGAIHQIAVNYATDVVNAITCPGVTITLGATDATALDTAFNANLNSNQGASQVVLDNQPVTFPAGNAGDFFVIPFNTDFHYNGTDSLVIETVRNGACNGALQLRTTSTAVVSNLSTSSATATLGTASKVYVDRELRFFGGDNRIAFPATGLPLVPVTEPFSNNSYDWHSYALYRIGDINGIGWINGLAFRVAKTTTLPNTFTLRVDLGYTTNTEINTQNVAATFTSPPVTVANNIAFTVPAETPAGSDLWIPLPANAFFYDGTANLLLRLVVSPPLAGSPPYTSVFLETSEHPSEANVRTRGPGDAFAEGAYTDIYNIKLRFAGGPTP